jgi:P27 family predicted phage terminase small subunit
MDPEAKAVWRRVLRDLRHTGVIRAADADVLRCYCEGVAGYEYAVRLLAQSGPLVRGQKGELVKNPLHQIVRDHRDAIRLFARELGLSPSTSGSSSRGHASSVSASHRPPTGMDWRSRCRMLLWRARQCLSSRHR